MYIVRFDLGKNVRKSVLLLNTLLISSTLLASYGHAATLRLVIPQFPPYTSESNNVFSGIGIELIEQVMQDIDVKYQLRATPNYARALEEVIRGEADGFFLASENKQRNQIAEFSEPLMLNRWSWFFRLENVLDPASDDFKLKANVATIHGSNTNKWLIQNKYNVTTKANSARLFPILLFDKKRIDAVFLASAVFQKELESQGYKDAEYVEVVQQSKPFGIYISKAYLEKHPNFMETLNASILKAKRLN